MDATNEAGHAPGSERPSLFVVGLDGSQTSWRALYYAFGLARRQHATLMVVFAFASIVDSLAAPVGVWHTGEELARDLHAAVEALAVEHHVETEFVRTSRDPVRTLTDLASARQADAIVIGASRALSHKLFGSKAARTVRRSRCPVIVVP